MGLVEASFGLQWQNAATMMMVRTFKRFVSLLLLLILLAFVTYTLIARRIRPFVIWFWSIFVRWRWRHETCRHGRRYPRLATCHERRRRRLDGRKWRRCNNLPPQRGRPLQIAWCARIFRNWCRLWHVCNFLLLLIINTIKPNLHW